MYGLARVTHCWNVSRATVYRHRQEAPAPKRRPGPLGPCDDTTLVAHIEQEIADSRFTGQRTARSGRGCGWRGSAARPDGCGG
jgi:hypothetical protein